MSPLVSVSHVISFAAMPTSRISACASAVRTRRYLIESVRPLFGVPLDLLRVATVGQDSQPQVAGAHDSALGGPDPGGIVGLALAVAQLEALAAELER